jgi:hypothetical protein
MDAKTLATIANVKVGTLNAWVQRGLIPGMTAGASGKRRSIDISTAVRVVIISTLVKFGLPTEVAAGLVAAGVTDEQIDAGGFLYFPGVLEYRYGPGVSSSIGHVLEHSEIPRIYATVADPPVIYAVINLGELTERTRQAEAEWQQTRGGDKADG